MTEQDDPNGARTAIQPLRPFPEFVVAGHTLTQSEAAEILEGLTRRDALLEHYQRQEKDLGKQTQERQSFLQEVLKNLRAPLIGYGLQEGGLTGMHHDRWVGPRLSLTIQPRRPVSGIVLRGWVPDDMPGGGQLIVKAGDEIASIDLVSGRFLLAVEIPGSTEAAISLTLEATRWITPEGPSGRKLVFVLMEIELEHPR